MSGDFEALPLLEGVVVGRWWGREAQLELLVLEEGRSGAEAAGAGGAGPRRFRARKLRQDRELKRHNRQKQCIFHSTKVANPTRRST